MSGKFDPDSFKQEVPALDSIGELLAYALALEQEATERYAELAELMATHNNRDVAESFRKMARIEQLHVNTIRERIEHNRLTDLPTAHFRWVGLTGGPESTDPADLHYLMTPRQALSLALLNEQRAHVYYDRIANQARDPEVKELASELAEEEKEHVAMVEAWLKRFPETEDDWDHDDDPPILQD
jgi:rubrerythrin